MEVSKQKNEINVLFIIQSLLHHWYVILIAVLVLGLGAFSFAKLFVTPTYSSTVKFYVNNDSDSVNVSSSELQAAQDLVNTYIAILETPDTLNMIIEKAGLSCNSKQLNKMIQATTVNQTEVFAITVTTTDPEASLLIAQTICEVFPDRISDIVTKSSVKIVQYAELPEEPVSPNFVSYALVGMLLGLFGSAAVILLKEIADNSIHDDSYASQTYPIRTLAYVPGFFEKGGQDGYADTRSGGEARSKKHLGGVFADERVILCEQLPFGAAESYRMLRTNIRNISDNENTYKVIGITSPTPGDGKSTLAINYAYTVAQTGKKVLLIEADLRKPVLAKRLSLEKRIGLSDMLLDSSVDATQNSQKSDHWKVISAGSAVDNPAELLSERGLDLLIDRVRGEYDRIIVDLPPVNVVSDAVIVSRCLDGMICAVKRSSTTRIALENAMHHLAYSKAEVIGFVVNNASKGGKGGKYGKYGKSYGSYEA